MLIESETSEPTPSGICSSVIMAVLAMTSSVGSDSGNRIPRGRGPRHARVAGMPRLRPSVAELSGALAGAGAIGLAYAAGRRYGLTRSDIARTLAPGNPAAGRAAQLALGTLAALPGRPRRARRARARGRRGARRRSPRAMAAAFSACAHALAALVAQRVARRAQRVALSR